MKNYRFPRFLLELQVPGILLRSVKLPNSPNENHRFTRFFAWGLWRPGAPGTSCHGEWLSSAINISPGLLTTSGEMTILYTGAVKLPENLSLSRFQEAGGFLHGPGSMLPQELERKRMDWLLGLLIPLKWAVVLIAVYFLVMLIL